MTSFQPSTPASVVQNPFQNTRASVISAQSTPREDAAAMKQHENVRAAYIKAYSSTLRGEHQLEQANAKMGTRPLPGSYDAHVYNIYKILSIWKGKLREEIDAHFEQGKTRQFTEADHEFAATVIDQYSRLVKQLLSIVKEFE